MSVLYSCLVPQSAAALQLCCRSCLLLSVVEAVIMTQAVIVIQASMQAIINKPHIQAIAAQLMQ